MFSIATFRSSSENLDLRFPLTFLVIGCSTAIPQQPWHPWIFFKIFGCNLDSDTACGKPHSNLKNDPTTGADSSFYFFQNFLELWFCNLLRFLTDTVLILPRYSFRCDSTLPKQNKTKALKLRISSPTSFFDGWLLAQCQCGPLTEAGFFVFCFFGDWTNLVSLDLRLVIPSASRRFKFY